MEKEARELGLTEKTPITDRKVITETKKGQMSKGNVSETATKGGKKFTIK